MFYCFPNEIQLPGTQSFSIFGSGRVGYLKKSSGRVGYRDPVRPWLCEIVLPGRGQRSTDWDRNLSRFKTTIPSIAVQLCKTFNPVSIRSNWNRLHGPVAIAEPICVIAPNCGKSERNSLWRSTVFFVTISPIRAKLGRSHYNIAELDRLHSDQSDPTGIVLRLQTICKSCRNVADCRRHLPNVIRVAILSIYNPAGNRGDRH